MPSWINVNRGSLLQQSTTQTIGTVKVQASVSPDDLPVRVSGQFDSATRVFHMLFQYMSGPEKVDLVKVNSHIVVLIGKRSRRLHEIQFWNIDGGEPVAEHVKFWFRKAVDSLKDRVERPRRLNYAAASDVAQSIPAVYDAVEA